MAHAAPPPSAPPLDPAEHGLTREAGEIRWGGRWKPAPPLATFSEYDDPRGQRRAGADGQPPERPATRGCGVVPTRPASRLLPATTSGPSWSARGAGYLLLSGDLWFPQAALQPGHARYLRLRAQGLPVDAGTVAILRRSAFRRDHLRDGFGPDRDRAASISATQGDRSRRRLPREAQRSAAHPDDYDRACWRRQKARLAELRKDRNQALRYLREAHDNFARAGHTVSAVEAEIQRLRRTGAKG